MWSVVDGYLLKFEITSDYQICVTYGTEILTHGCEGNGNPIIPNQWTYISVVLNTNETRVYTFGS